MVDFSPDLGLVLEEGAVMDTQIIIAALGFLGTAWGAWLTYRGVKVKGRQDSQAVNFAGMQSEINRLREDLADRDKQARENYDEIIQLRADMKTAQTEIHDLQRSLTEWITGAQVLYRQLVDADITPMFVPSTLSSPSTKETLP